MFHKTVCGVAEEHCADPESGSIPHWKYRLLLYKYEKGRLKEKIFICPEHNFNKKVIGRPGVKKGT